MEEITKSGREAASHQDDLTVISAQKGDKDAQELIMKKYKNLVKKNRYLKKMNTDLIYRLCQKNKTIPEQETGIKEDF